MSRATIQLPDKFTYQTKITIRITDINYGGHLGNDTMLSLLQEARIRFLKQHNYSETDVEGCGIIMADAVIIYKAQAFYPDTLIIEITASDFSKRACDLIYRVTRESDNKEIARAKTRIAFFDYHKNITVKVPLKFQQLFQT
jgi:acyl-CoA thioesterase FadM